MWTALFTEPQRFGPASGLELSKACQELTKTPTESPKELKRRFKKLREYFSWYSGGFSGTSQPLTKSSRFFQDIANCGNKTAKKT